VDRLVPHAPRHQHMTDRPRARGARRVLYVENVGWGFLTHRISLALAARRAGYDVHVATNVETPDEHSIIASHGFSFHRLHLARGLKGIGGDLQSCAAMLSLYRSLRPDIVHHVTVKPVIYGSLLSRLMPSMAVVNTVSGLGYLYVANDRSTRLLRSLASAGYRAAFARRKSWTIFQNDDDRRRFPALANAVVIEGSGVDLERFAPTEQPHGTVTVVLPARMLRAKGVVEFARAARELRAAGARARFYLAGVPDIANPGSLSEGDLRGLERECGVEWLGYCADMPRVLREASIVCLPSYYGEGVPKSLLEAAASGRPIVTTDLPGCRQVVAHERNGLLVPPLDVPSLTAALRRLIDDPLLRSRFGSQGRAIAESRFDVNRVNEETLAIYDKLLAERGFSATTAAM
jgi:glycosyltransferase involved in cell wall biosynthesis